MKKYILLILLTINLSASIPIKDVYAGPTEMLIQRESWDKIEGTLMKLNMTDVHFSYFNQIASYETWGHIGYHGATQDYRVYQDVIKWVIEEIVGIQVRDDFHFLRIPGDKDLNLNSVKEFIDYWGKRKIDNRNDTRAKQLLSLNFGIYSNYNVNGSCSVCYFYKDKSAKDVDYPKMLEPFFNELGIATTNIKALFSIADRWLTADLGVLLQISENSHLTLSENKAYTLADSLCYPAERGGILYDRSDISKHYQTVMGEAYVTKKTDIAPQLRLLINNRYTLNPKSYFSIQRWDLYHPEIINQYEEEMRNKIKSVSFDSTKVKAYKDKILKEWSKK